MKKKLLAVVLLFVCCLSLVGCGAISTAIIKFKGSLVGNDYTIQQFDDFGNLVFTTYGDRVDMEGELDENDELISSYLNITIDGQEWQHVGGTLVFAQEGVDMITNFQVPEEMESSKDSSGLIAVDRVINKYRNYFGKKLVVLVSSQNGTPIGLYQGNSCYTEVPEHLPKTTLINIDGKLIYVHRANIDILPAELFDE